MKTDSIDKHTAILCLGCLLVLTGCQTPSSQIPVTGFLSDYSLLEPVSQKNYRYSNPAYDIGDYGTFIIDSAVLILDEPEPSDIKNSREFEKLRVYLRRTFVETLIPRYTATAVTPGPGVAEIRLALVNVNRSFPLDFKDVYLEMEVLDSLTNEQIFATIEGEKKDVLLYAIAVPRYAARVIMDDWSLRFYYYLEEEHGY